MKYLSVNNRILIFLLSLFISLATIVIGMGESKAYYLNEATHQIVCEKTQNFPISNIMEEAGQMVLLKDWELSDVSKTQVEIIISLSAGDKDFKGYITCEAAAGYLSATLIDANNVSVSSEQLLVIKAGETTNIRLRLQKNVDALNNINEKLQETVKVVWTNHSEKEEEPVQSMFANVVVNIIPKTVIVPEVVEDEIADDVVDDASNGDIIIEDSVEQEDTYLTDGSAWNTDVDMMVMRNGLVSVSDPLVADITYPIDAETIEITTNSFADTEGFPAFTKYSLDGGQTYVILAEGGKIQLPVSETGSEVLQIDFSKTQTSWDAGTCVIETVGIKGESKTTSQSDSVEMKSSTTESLDVTTESKVPLVTAEEPVIWNVNSSIQDVDYKIEVLTKEGYRDVLPEDMLVSEVVITDGQGTISISSQNGQAKAGTYRLRVIQKYEDIEVQKKEVTFFVNYRQALKG